MAGAHVSVAFASRFLRRRDVKPFVMYCTVVCLIAACAGQPTPTPEVDKGIARECGLSASRTEVKVGEELSVKVTLSPPEGWMEFVLYQSPQLFSVQPKSSLTEGELPGRHWSKITIPGASGPSVDAVFDMIATKVGETTLSGHTSFEVISGGRPESWSGCSAGSVKILVTP